LSIDGAICSATLQQPPDKPNSFLDPDAIASLSSRRFANAAGIAQTYLNILRQPRNAWTWEIELRPWFDTF
jgi:hypothetical protein